MNDVTSHDVRSQREGESQFARAETSQPVGKDEMAIDQFCDENDGPELVAARWVHDTLTGRPGQCAGGPGHQAQHYYECRRL